MKILGLIVILTLAYFNLKEDVSVAQIVYFLVGGVITFHGFAMLADHQALLSGIGLIAIGLIVMKPPFILRGN